MIVAGMCRHCGAERRWIREQDGSYQATGDALLCAVRAGNGSQDVDGGMIRSSKPCEPVPEDQRMTYAIAASAARRSMGFRRKRR